MNQIAFPPEPEVGEVYEGEVVNITKFGAFVNILPGRDGLLHISRIDGSTRVERVEDYLSEGDELKVRVREMDRGKVSLELVEPLEGATLPSDNKGGGNGGSKGSGGRSEGRKGGDRGGSGGRKGGDGGGKRDQKSDKGDGDKAASSGRRKPARSFDEAFEEMSDN